MSFEEAPSMRYFLIFWLFLLSTIAFLDRTNISIAGVALAREYQLDKVHLGWIFSAFLLGYAACQVPGGWLAARIGPRRVLTASVVCWGIFTAMTAVVPVHASHALLWLILVRFALGMSESAVYPGANQFVARWIPLQERGKANGWIFAGVGAGSALAPPLLTAIMSSYGWRVSFWFCALVGVVAALVWYGVARDRPEDHPRVRAAELAHIRAGVAPESTDDSRAVPWGALLLNKEVWGLSVSYFAFGYVVWIFFSWFFIYLAEVRGLNLSASALYSMLPFAAMTVCCLAGGVINDWVAKRYGLRWGRCGLAVVSMIVTAVFLVGGSMAQSTLVAALVLAGGAGAIYLSQSSFWSAASDFAGSHTGVVSGVMNMACQIGGALTASLTPWIAARLGWNAAFIAAALVALVGAGAWLCVNPGRPLVDRRMSVHNVTRVFGSEG
jgi:ACS family glucarate transporter-like MFS transporter